MLRSRRRLSRASAVCSHSSSSWPSHTAGQRYGLSSSRFPDTLTVTTPRARSLARLAADGDVGVVDLPAAAGAPGDGNHVLTRVDGEVLQIGELAALTGASRRSLRYHEDQGLLAARRETNGYRLYDPDSVDLVHRIKGLLGLGLPVKAVRTILPCVVDRDLSATPCREVRVTLRDSTVSLVARLNDSDTLLMLSQYRRAEEAAVPGSH
jgi:DNA-binding transcriptional MerR regulator